MKIASAIRMSSVVAAMSLAVCTGPVHAQEASSRGYGISASLNLLTLEALNVPPSAEVQFSPQETGFEDDAFLAGLDEVSATGLLVLSTGELSAATQYLAPTTANGFAVVGTQASAANIQVSAETVTADNLLDLTASLLRSHAMVSGYCPPGSGFSAGRGNVPAGAADEILFNNGFDIQTLHAGGGSDGFDDNGSPSIGISVSGQEVLGIPLDPDPNTSIDLLGLGTLILNEQTITGDGISSLGMASNALHLDLAIAGVLEAEVIIAHSEAAMTCP